MNDEIKQYLKNYLGDLDHWSGTHSMEDLNHITSGTPPMHNEEGLATYTARLAELLEDEAIRLKKSRIGSLEHWEEQFLEGGVDDEHRLYIVSVLAAERRDLESRVEVYEENEDG